jgi:hypothetical protein
MSQLEPGSPGLMISMFAPNAEGVGSAVLARAAVFDP